VRQSTLLTVGVGCLAVALVIAFVRWLIACNRRPDGPERIVALLLILVIAESALYQNQDTIPTSLFHLQAGSVSFRVYDVLVPLAVLARLIARPKPRRSPIQVTLWSAFLVWYLFEAIAGLLGGNPKDFVAYEAKFIVYLGTFVLVAAVPARRWLESPVLRRTIVGASILAALLIVASEAGLSINAANPVIPLLQFGDLGSDAATVFVILGVPTLAVGVCSEQHRLRTILVSLPLIASPLAAGQRASLLEVLASVVVLAILLAPRRHMLRVGGAEVSLAVGVVVGAVALLVLVSALSPKPGISVPFASSINQTFNSQGKQESAQDRLNQWAQARHLIAQRPVFGWGLGKTYEYYMPGFYEFAPTDLTHNIVLDLLVRSGAVGLLLFTIGWLASLLDLWESVRNATDPRLMALAAGVLAAFVGVIVHGQVESIFEKYRIAVMIGMLAGVSVSFGSELLAPRRTADEALAPETKSRELVAG
jgi:O-antigen ligase